jgi:uncharacterized membrane protein
MHILTLDMVATKKQFSYASSTPLPQSTPNLFNSGNAQLGLNWTCYGIGFSVFIFIRAKVVCCHAKSSSPVEYDTAREINVVPSSSVYKPVMTNGLLLSVRSSVMITNSASIVAFHYI